ncbi:hypothetical protein SLEP1_g1451 [Rubroshorea leprosula]|uniref:Reverse transcriptase Ty1/copia-type domain-containing protein n=1 Tax=Rubroshorea leprosula TaxID=152421 RepID=A0AAV5HDT7_9ROSI|nr:hypothetical protein SLEP1_g1451 [Rubroshorea leprosula]
MASESSATITSPPISTNAAISAGQNTIITFNAAAHFPLKLTPSNYPSWRAQFLSILTSIRHAILTSVSEPIAPYISAAETSQQAWRTLANLYANHSRSRVFTLKERLQNTRREGRTISEFLHQLKMLADELAAIDKPLTNDDLTVHVLNGIGPEFREIFASIRAGDEPLSFEELHDRLVTHEESMHREETRLVNSPVTAHFAAMPTRRLAGNNPTFSTNSGLSNASFQSNGAGILPLPHNIQHFGSGHQMARGRGNGRQRPNHFNRNRGGPNRPNTSRPNISCQLCNHFGHTARTCSLFRNQGQGPAVHYAASTNPNTNEWVIDSSANNHITTDLSNLALHSEYNGPDELIIGDGSGLKITHTSTKSASLFPSASPAPDSAPSPAPLPALLPPVPSTTANPPLQDFIILISQDASPPTACGPDLVSSPPCSGISCPLTTSPVAVDSLPSPSPSSSSPSPVSSSSPASVSPSAVPCSPSPSPAPIPPHPAPPNTHRTHPMVTRSLNHIFKPKQMHLATKYPLPTTVEPSCVSQALSHPQWLRAMSDEFDALVRQGTWDLVPASPTQNVIGCKWVFRLKRGKNGEIERYKARLVAKGFHQRPGHDYSNTFSPVIKPTTIRTVFTIAVNQAWPIRQLDVNNAFLHGFVEEDLYMAQSAGFIDQNLPHHVCKLKKAIYGLKQAPRAWYTELKQFLLACGLVNSRSDCSLFIYNKSGIVLYVLVYVDDLLITGNSTAFISDLITKLGQKFSLKDLGELSLFLGVEAKSKMDGAKTIATPMSSSGLSPQSGSPPLSDATAYRQLLGSLQYLSLTRPDILFAVNKLSQYMHCPTELHWQAGDKDTFVSTTDYLVFLGATPISWKASKQKAIARSSIEAEYRALAAASSELVWVLHLLRELGLPSGTPPVLYCDNVGATYLSSNPVMHSRMKHIAIDLHFIRDLVDKRILRVSHIASADQLADGLTKPLPSFRFALLRSKIGVVDGSTILRGRIKATADTAPSVAQSQGKSKLNDSPSMAQSPGKSSLDDSPDYSTNLQ